MQLQLDIIMNATIDAAYDATAKAAECTLAATAHIAIDDTDARNLARLEANSYVSRAARLLLEAKRALQR